MRAIGLWEQGETQAAVARRVGVVPQTVARWVVQYRRHGKAGLKKAGRAGRKPQMDQQDRERLHVLLRKGTKALGYEMRPWTCLRVADLIKREFGVRYHPGHVWKILVALGWSPQRPAGLGHDRKKRENLCWKSDI
jgi:transposase